MDNPSRKPSPLWRKSLVTAVGGVVLLAGLIMIVTPGPGLAAIAAGLVILGTEYHWARRLLVRVRARLEREKRRFMEGRNSTAAHDATTTKPSPPEPPQPQPEPPDHQTR